MPKPPMKPASTKAEAQTLLPKAKLVWTNHSDSNRRAATPDRKKSKQMAPVMALIVAEWFW